MRVSVEDLNDPVRYLRHIVRVEGGDRAVETLLRHVDDQPGGHYADDDEMAAALQYIDGQPAVLEFHPQFYVTAGFAMTDYAITRGPGRATIVFDVAWLETELVRLLAAFHPAVSIDAAVVDTCHKYDSSLINSFRQGRGVRQSWRHLYVSEIPSRVLSGLTDQEWLETENYSREALFDAGSRVQTGRAAHIRVRGPSEHVQSLRASLLASEMKHTACFLDDWNENDLTVRLRSPKGVHGIARAWSRVQPELEVDTVVTDPIGKRSHERFIAGKTMAARTIEVARDELCETFSHRVTFWASGTA